MKKLLLLSGLLLLITPGVFAQKASEKHQMNFVKVNLTSLFLKNYGIQYERVLSKRVSAAIGFRLMPYTTIPFKDKIIDMANFEDQEPINILNHAQMANYAITPEIRFYLGKKGYGRGFYIAPYYRYATYDVNNVDITFEVDEGGVPSEKSIKLAGNLASHTGGIMFGAQWALGKYVSLDWWILGPAYGVSSGVLDGLPSEPIPADGQADLKQEIESLEIPMVKQTATVTANSVKVDITGPWAGIRSGIIIGIKF